MRLSLTTPSTPLCASLVIATLLTRVTACRPTPQVPHRTAWFCMGTVAAIQCADTRQGSAAAAVTTRHFAETEQLFSAWRTNSCLSRINHAAGGDRAIPVPWEMAHVLQAALQAAEASDGAFNPLLGPLLHAWGLTRADTPPMPPDPDRLLALNSLTAWRLIALRTLPDGVRTVRLPRAGMSLDLGAIAKGFAVDQAWQSLMQAGHTNLLIDLGGNLRAIGEAVPGRNGWRTAIRNPFDRDAIIGRFLMKHGEAVATSGNYERFVEIHGIRYAHILDGRSGEPVHGMAGVTVIAPNAMTADLLSTTLFILGPRQGAAFLKRYRGCDALWIPDTPDDPHLIATPAFAARIADTLMPPFRLITLPADCACVPPGAKL